MKRRTFYIINLDRNRIFILTVLFVGLICVAYATGFRFGRAQGPGGVEALSYQDLMGLPAEDKSENTADGAGAINPTDIGDLPEEHPVRQDEGGRDAPLPQAPPDSGATMEQAGEMAAPGRLPRISPEEAPAAPARKERSSLNLQKRTQNAQADRNRKENRTHSRPAETERPLAANRTAPENAQSKKSIGDSLAANNQARLQNREPSRLSFERSSRPVAAQDRKTEAGSAARVPKTGPAVTPQESGKKTVALRNVGPGTTTAPDPRTAPASNPTGAQTDREYSLQLGSYSDRDSAFRLAGSLKRHGFTPYVYRSGGKFAVRVGKTDRPQNLETLEDRLREKRYSPMRISYRRQDR